MTNTSPQPDDKELRQKAREIIERYHNEDSDILANELVQLIHERDKHRDAVVDREARLDELDLLGYVDWGDDLNPIVDELIEKNTAERKAELEQSNQQQKGASRE